ncbi:7061_t:CDS:2 [Diversispora eburnea]|uniref:7061_t:CDS:1 n=1 Tax=Diversispora eburnea TaxID=1213867 RepID=A0A9N8YLX6_9GLOM|nr:7061_t:CDS:2 [Diversispora eburnea]
MLRNYPTSLNDDLIVEPPQGKINAYTGPEFVQERKNRQIKFHDTQICSLIKLESEERKKHRLKFLEHIKSQYGYLLKEDGKLPIQSALLAGPLVNLVQKGENNLIDVVSNSNSGMGSVVESVMESVIEEGEENSIKNSVRRNSTRRSSAGGSSVTGVGGINNNLITGKLGLVVNSGGGGVLVNSGSENPIGKEKEECSREYSGVVNLGGENSVAGSVESLEEGEIVDEYMELVKDRPFTLYDQLYQKFQEEYEEKQQIFQAKKENLLEIQENIMTSTLRLVADNMGQEKTLEKILEVDHHIENLDLIMNYFRELFQEFREDI